MSIFIQSRLSIYSLLKDDDTVYQWLMHCLCFSVSWVLLVMQYPHLHYTLLGNLICLPLVVLQWYFSVLVLLVLSACFSWQASLGWSCIFRRVQGHNTSTHYGMFNFPERHYPTLQRLCLNLYSNLFQNFVQHINNILMHVHVFVLILFEWHCTQ